MARAATGWCVFEIGSEWVLRARARDVVELLSEPLAITQWWSSVFMAGEIIERGDAFGVGCTVRLHTKGLLPHTFQFVARIAESDGRDRMVIVTRGDFEGRGELHLVQRGDDVHVTIDWTVDVRKPWIRPLLGLFKPVFIANHRWAMRQGRIGLERELQRRARSREDVPLSTGTPTFPHNLAFMRTRFRWNDRKVAAWKD